MAGSEDLKEISETCINDGRGGKRLVKPGDKVNFLPANLYDWKMEDAEYFAKEHIEFLREWLGEGPFTIKWIGLWPCGRVMLYFKGGKSDGAGAYASEFM